MTLFRHATDLNHWYARTAAGWVRFPSRMNGWHSRRWVRQLDEDLLQEVPLWLAFNTGIPGAPRPSPETIWRNKLRKAEQAYRDAFAEAQRIWTEYDSMPPSDGNFALRRALDVQNAAIGQYARVLKALTKHGT